MAKKVLVVLDPGHHTKYNKGAVAGYYEGDRMYDLSEYESTALKSYGIDVIFTRKRDGDMEVYNRGQVAVKNANGYDVVMFMSNHSNAHNGKACGVEVFRSTHLPESEELAQKLIDTIVDVMKPVTKITYSRGVKTRLWGNKDYFGVIRGSVSGASSKSQALNGPIKYTYLVEHGFHDNVTECEFINDTNNLKKIAEAKAKVIADYFGLSKSAFPTKTESVNVGSTRELYRVRKSWENVKSQKGAYRNLANAKAEADKNPGYFVFNSKGEKVYPVATKPSAVLKVGDKVKMSSLATIYGKKRKFSFWVYKSTLYVRDINGDRVVISTLKTGAITGAVDKKYLTKL